MKRFANISPENILNLTDNLDSNKNPEKILLHKDYIEFEKSKNVNDEEFLEDGELVDKDNYIKEEFSSSITIELNEIHTKTREFNSAVREAPNNIQLWLEYVAFQDTALGSNDFTSNKQELKDNELKCDKKGEQARNVLLRNKAVIEKKLSILN